MSDDKKTRQRLSLGNHFVQGSGTGPSRRNVVRGAGLLVGGFRPRLVMGAAALSVGDDPVLAAITRHGAALKVFNHACTLTDDVAARKAGRKITADAIGAFRAAEDLAATTFTDLLGTAPVTLDGLRTFLIYIRDMDHDDISAALDTVLRSPLFDEADHAGD